MGKRHNIHILHPPSAGASDGTRVPDEEISQAFKNNEGRLISYLSHRLNSLSDAQDGAQAVFVRMWQRREELHRGNLSSMLFVIARNYATDMLRSRQRDRLTFSEMDVDVAETIGMSDDPSADRVIAARQDLKLISSILKELPEKCRYSFIRYKFEECSYREIARDLGVTESMVRKYVLRAIAYCADRFAELEGWE